MDVTVGQAFEIVRCKKCRLLIDVPYGLECGHFLCRDCALHSIKTYELDGQQLQRIYCSECEQAVEAQEEEGLSAEVARFITIISNR